MLEGHTGDDARDMLRSGSVITERLSIDNKQDLKKNNKKNLLRSARGHNFLVGKKLSSWASILEISSMINNLVASGRLNCIRIPSVGVGRYVQKCNYNHRVRISMETRVKADFLIRF